jgi:hypothetical protein
MEDGQKTKVQLCLNTHPFANQKPFFHHALLYLLGIAMKLSFKV